MPGLRRLPEAVLVHEAKGTRGSAALETSFQPAIFVLASAPATTVVAAENDQGYGMHQPGVLRSGPGRLQGGAGGEWGGSSAPTPRRCGPRRCPDQSWAACTRGTGRWSAWSAAPRPCAAV